MRHIFTSIATVIGPVLLVLQFQSCSGTSAGARSTSSAPELNATSSHPPTPQEKK